MVLALIPPLLLSWIFVYSKSFPVAVAQLVIVSVVADGLTALGWWLITTRGSYVPKLVCPYSIEVYTSQYEKHHSNRKLPLARSLFVRLIVAGCPSMAHEQLYAFDSQT